MNINFNLIEKIYFFNIGPYKRDNETFFEWKSKNYFKTNIFDIRLTRNAPYKKKFYCVSKADLKLVYYTDKDIVFSIGADLSIQSSLIEGLIEYLFNEFFEMYDESLLMTCYGDYCNIFDG
ncbi:MAG: hypothetical protein ACTSQJ_04945, partial [Promethearchaeota archaeon]